MAGKTMLASSVALHMVTGPQWGAVYWVDLHGCTNDRAAIFAFLAACGVPSDVPDAAALLAWLCRVRPWLLFFHGFWFLSPYHPNPECLRLLWCLPCAACRCGRLEG